jgi:hypothetical protein
MVIVHLAPAQKEADSSHFVPNGMSRWKEKSENSLVRLFEVKVVFEFETEIGKRFEKGKQIIKS